MLSSRQIAAIQAHQQAELQSFVADESAAQMAARSPQYARVADWLPPNGGGRVLECGCGPGRFVALLAKLGYHVVGIDPHEFPTWQLLRDRLDVDMRSGVHVEQLPFADAYFDHAVCLGALLYFADPGKALLELHRVIRPGGRLVLRTVNKHNLYTSLTGRKLDPASRNLYDERGLVALIEQSGFTVASTFSYGFWPPVMTDLWWYLCNGKISPRLQHGLSRATPARNRVNITVFATRA